MKFITRKQLSERWSVPVETIKKWDQEGRNPVTTYKIGPGRNAGIRYKLEEIEAYECGKAIMLPPAVS